MKANFRFIANNKMKAGFCFIDSTRRDRLPRAVATSSSRSALRRDLISAQRNQRRSDPVRTLARLADFLVLGPGCFHFHSRKRQLATTESAAHATEKEFSFPRFVRVFLLGK